MRQNLARIGAVVVSLASLLLAAVACAQGARSAHPSFDVSQRLVLPLIEGVAYDQSGNQVFVSLCPVRAHDCNLGAIDLSDRVLRYVRTDGAYGYTQPAVSEDGRFVFVVRTPRRQRPSQRVIDQELVRLDLTSDSETVVAPAGDHRYDRVIAVGGQAVLAVRSYRSSERVQCRGDFCTDVARLVLVDQSGVRGAPLVVAADGPLGQGMLQLAPLGAGGVWIVGSEGETSYQNGLPVRRGSAWLLDTGRFDVLGPARDVAMERTVFDQFARAHAGALRWRWDQLSATGARLELRQFARDGETSGGVEQVGLSPAGRGVRVTKRRNGGAIRLEVEVVENSGVSPWQHVNSVSVAYAPPN